MKKGLSTIQAVGIIGNPEKRAGAAAIRHAARLVTRAGRLVLTEPATAQLAGLHVEELPDQERLARECDLLLVFGGDGTILTVARETAGSATPILGVNLGRLGFLTTTSTRGLSRCLDRVWKGQCEVEDRYLIQAEAPLHAKTPPMLALNDFVISRGAVPRLIELEVKVDGDLLTSYRGDGLIISSPTGSTAYSLAAGGAVISPQAAVFALTPICPHTLSSRSVIISLDSVIEVRLLSRKVETLLASDGHFSRRLSANEVVVVRRSPHFARLIRLPGSTFFRTLRQKLNWSGSTL